MINQLVYIIGMVIISPLLPFLFILGSHVRKTMPDLPETPGPTFGTIQGENGEMKMLCLGESSVAGVGIKSHSEGFVGRIAARISNRTGFRVSWNVVARSGCTAKRVTEELVPLIPDMEMDLVVVGLGGNDTFKLNSPQHWFRHIQKLSNAIQLKQPNSKIVFANMPPVGHFPAFPKAIQLIFGGIIKLHSNMAAKLASIHPGVHYLNNAIRLDKWLEQLNDGTTLDDLFTDGVHPSTITYSIWGAEIADFIVDQNLIKP